MNKTTAEYLFVFLRGLLMGACDIIPGVSGGTIAFITGIYERLITAIGNIGPGLLTTLLKRDIDGFKAELKKIDILFLVVLVIGIGIAFLSISKVILILLNEYTGPTYAFFLGLIAASAVILFIGINLKKNAVTAAVMLIVGLAAGYVLGGLDTASLGHSLPVIFFTGMAALCALILPGISGAYITVVLGQYEYLLECIHTLNIVPIIVGIAGGLIGLLGFTRILKYLLKKYPAEIVAFLTGLMLGSARLLIAKVSGSGGFDASCIILAVVGAAVVLGVEVLRRIAAKKEN